MSEMVERVARVLWQISNEGLEHEDDIGPAAFERLKHIYSVEARRAIEAMREPTEAMLEAHHVVPDDTNFRERALRNWQAIIDEALK